MININPALLLGIVLLIGTVEALEDTIDINDDNKLEEIKREREDNSTVQRNPADVFDGVYSECVVYLSYSCIQRKTLTYLRDMVSLDEVPIIGNYVKFVKVSPSPTGDTTNVTERGAASEQLTGDLSAHIDAAVDEFFERHRLRVRTLGRDVDVARTVEEFVGRKRRKGGGGGGGDKGDGGKKKMMMMAMMCMKMKMMVMVPAMMGMMGMMSFKGMMFSMMSFMIAKMMLLMKILEKKGGGSGGGASDAGWAAGGGGGGGGGGGAWMPAGGGGGSSDGYGGPGGGYNAAGEWQSRSIPELLPQDMTRPVHVKRHLQPIISYVTPLVRYSNGNADSEKRVDLLKNLNDERIISENVRQENEDKHIDTKVKSRRKRGIMDLVNYFSTILKKNIFQTNFKALTNQMNAYPKYRIINGIKYVYYPQKMLNRFKYPKMMPLDSVKHNDDSVKQNAESEAKPIVTVEDFNKGEIVDQVAEARMNRKKILKMKDTVKDVVEDNPWE